MVARADVLKAALEAFRAPQAGTKSPTGATVAQAYFPDASRAVRELLHDIGVRKSDVSRAALDVLGHLLGLEDFVRKLSDDQQVKTLQALISLLEATRTKEVAVAAVWALSNQRLSVAVLEPQLEKLLQVLQVALGPTAPWGSSQRCHFYAILTLTYMYKHLAPQMLLKPHWVAYAWRYLLEEAADIKPEGSPAQPTQGGSETGQQASAISKAALDLMEAVTPSLLPIWLPLMSALLYDLLPPKLTSQSPNGSQHPPPAQLLSRLQSACKSRDPSHMVRGVRAWGCIARLLSSNVMYSTKDILSPMLKMMEGPFGAANTNQPLAVAAFASWGALVDSFFISKQLHNPKRVALLLKPIFASIMVASEPQEALHCWSHLMSMIFKDDTAAVANGITHLIIPVLQKVMGDSTGLAATTGCSAPPSVAGRALSSRLSTQVLKALGCVRQPSIVCALASQIGTTFLQPATLKQLASDQATDIVNGIPDVLASWLQKVQDPTIPSEAKAQVLAELYGCWSALLALPAPLIPASPQDNQFPGPWLAGLIQVAFAANKLAASASKAPYELPVIVTAPQPSANDSQTASGLVSLAGKWLESLMSRCSPQSLVQAGGLPQRNPGHSMAAFEINLWLVCQAQHNVDLSSNAWQTLEKRFETAGTSGYPCSFWSSILDTITSLAQSQTAHGGRSLSTNVSIRIWKLMASKLNQSADDPLADHESSSQQHPREGGQELCSFLLTMLLSPFALLSRAQDADSAEKEELDIKELPSVWAALHAHLLRQLRRKALDQHSTPQEAILEMTGSMLKHIRTLLEQQPAHSLDMLELAIAATAASFAQVQHLPKRLLNGVQHHGPACSPCNDHHAIQDILAPLTGLLLEEYLHAIATGTQASQRGGLGSTDSAPLDQLLGMLLPMEHSSMRSKQHVKDASQLQPANLVVRLLAAMPSLHDCGQKGASARLLCKAWTALLSCLRSALDTLAAHISASNVVPSPESAAPALPGMLSSLTAALQHPDRAVASAAFEICSADWFSKAVEDVGQEMPAELSEAVASAALTHRKGGAHRAGGSFLGQATTPPSHAGGRQGYSHSSSPPSSARARPVQLKSAQPSAQHMSTSAARAADSPRRRLSRLFEPSQTEYVKIPSSTKAHKLLLPHQKDVILRQRQGAAREGITTYTMLDASQDAWQLHHRLPPDSEQDSAPEPPAPVLPPAPSPSKTAIREVSAQARSEHSAEPQDAAVQNVPESPDAADEQLPDAQGTFFRDADVQPQGRPLTAALQQQTGHDAVDGSPGQREPVASVRLPPSSTRAATTVGSEQHRADTHSAHQPGPHLLSAGNSQHSGGSGGSAKRKRKNAPERNSNETQHDGSSSGKRLRSSSAAASGDAEAELAENNTSSAHRGLVSGDAVRRTGSTAKLDPGEQAGAVQRISRGAPNTAHPQQFLDAEEAAPAISRHLLDHHMGVDQGESPRSVIADSPPQHSADHSEVYEAGSALQHSDEPLSHHHPAILPLNVPAVHAQPMQLPASATASGSSAPPDQSAPAKFGHCPDLHALTADLHPGDSLAQAANSMPGAHVQASSQPVGSGTRQQAPDEHQQPQPEPLEHDGSPGLPSNAERATQSAPMPHKHHSLYGSAISAPPQLPADQALKGTQASTGQPAQSHIRHSPSPSTAHHAPPPVAGHAEHRSPTPANDATDGEADGALDAANRSIGHLLQTLHAEGSPVHSAGMPVHSHSQLSAHARAPLSPLLSSRRLRFTPIPGQLPDMGQASPPQPQPTEQASAHGEPTATLSAATKHSAHSSAPRDTPAEPDMAQMMPAPSARSSGATAQRSHEEGGTDPAGGEENAAQGDMHGVASHSQQHARSEPPNASMDKEGPLPGNLPMQDAPSSVAQPSRAAEEAGTTPILQGSQRFYTAEHSTPAGSSPGFAQELQKRGLLTPRLQQFYKRQAEAEALHLQEQQAEREVTTPRSSLCTPAPGDQGMPQLRAPLLADCNGGHHPGSPSGLDRDSQGANSQHPQLGSSQPEQAQHAAFMQNLKSRGLLTPRLKVYYERQGVRLQEDASPSKDKPSAQLSGQPLAADDDSPPHPGRTSSGGQDVHVESAAMLVDTPEAHITPPSDSQVQELDLSTQLPAHKSGMRDMAGTRGSSHSHSAMLLPCQAGAGRPGPNTNAPAQTVAHAMAKQSQSTSDIQEKLNDIDLSQMSVPNLICTQKYLLVALEKVTEALQQRVA